MAVVVQRSLLTVLFPNSKERLESAAESKGYVLPRDVCVDL